MKAKEAMERYNICRETLCRWVKEGKIKYAIKPSGQYIYYSKEDVIYKDRKTVIYARCSTTGQKDNLERQIERLKSYISNSGYILDEVYSEIASALNYNRREYRKLYKNVISKSIGRIVIEYKDRLLRIGFDDFAELCKIHNVELIVVDNSQDKTKTQEIVDDMVSIIHHFSSKIYSNRKRKKIIEAIKQN